MGHAAIRFVPDGSRSFRFHLANQDAEICARRIVKDVLQIVSIRFQVFGEQQPFIEAPDRSTLADRYGVQSPDSARAARRGGWPETRLYSTCLSHRQAAPGKFLTRFLEPRLRVARRKSGPATSRRI
jgi:hypothetical protein